MRCQFEPSLVILAVAFVHTNRPWMLNDHFRSRPPTLPLYNMPAPKSGPTPKSPEGASPLSRSEEQVSPSLPETQERDRVSKLARRGGFATCRHATRVVGISSRLAVRIVL